MNRVLVTGATGFIGQHCLAPLRSLGYEIHAVTSREPADTDDGADVIWHRANLLDRSQVSEVVAEVRATHLLHLAWIVVPGLSYTSPDNFRWLQSSIDMVRDFKEHGGERVVVTGSAYEYDQNFGLCREEQTPLEPNTIYGICKNSLREILESMCGALELSLAWPRIFFLFGPHEHPNRLISSVVCSLLRGEPAKCSHGRQVRDYAYAGDVAEGLVRLLDSDVEGAINIASGEIVTLRDIVVAVGEKLDRQDLIQLGALPARPGECPIILADTTRQQDELNWQPPLGLDQGLDVTIEWWKTHFKTRKGRSKCQNS